MADFPDFDPAPGMTKSSAPATRKVQFGDGYETRLLYGLNQNPKIYNLTFRVSESESDTIEAFLDARAADSASFTYTPPGESSASNFVCEEWSKTIPFVDRAEIVATFRQVFEP
jgi:phage-related protein